MFIPDRILWHYSFTGIDYFFPSLKYRKNDFIGEAALSARLIEQGTVTRIITHV